MGVPSWDTFFVMIGPFSAMIGHVFGLKLSHRMIGVQAERFLTFFFFSFFKSTTHSYKLYDNTVSHFFFFYPNMVSHFIYYYKLLYQLII